MPTVPQSRANNIFPLRLRTSSGLSPVSLSPTRLATGVRQLRHDQMGQGLTEPHAGRGTFLLSSGGAGGRVLLSGLWFGGGSRKNQFPCQTLVVCLVPTALGSQPSHPAFLTTAAVFKASPPSSLHVCVFLCDNPPPPPSMAWNGKGPTVGGSGAVGKAGGGGWRLRRLLPSPNAAGASIRVPSGSQAPVEVPHPPLAGGPFLLEVGRRPAARPPQHRPRRGPFQAFSPPSLPA